MSSKVCTGFAPRASRNLVPEFSFLASRSATFQPFWRRWNSLSRTRAKKDRFNLGSRASPDDDSGLRSAFTLSLRGPRLKAVGDRVAVGEGVLSSSESSELAATALRSAFEAESAEVERRGGAVLLVYSSGVGICSLGSYKVRTFPLEIMRTVASRSNRNAVTVGVLTLE